MLTYPNIDPVLLQLGPLSIKWYGLAYIAGVVGGWWIAGKLNQRHNPPLMSKQAYDDIMVYIIIGIVLGGRLGYVLFYKPFYYLEHPAEIPMIWLGGMSFHGGFMGSVIALMIFARKFHIRFLSITDIAAVVAPLGILFGRLANFINGELYGRVTDSPLGMVFPHGGSLPRHPSQLYEAGLEGLLLLILLLFIAFRTRALQRPGLLSGLFMIGYGLMRATAEIFREPDAFLGFILPGITMGQLLCIPMILLGLVLVLHRDAPQPVDPAHH